jgi:hypothetical protein
VDRLLGIILGEAAMALAELYIAHCLEIYLPLDLASVSRGPFSWQESKRACILSITVTLDWSTSLTVSRRFELSVTPRNCQQKSDCKKPSYRLHLVTEWLSSRSSAVDEFVNPNLENDFGCDFGCGFGAKVLPRLFAVQSPSGFSVPA